MRSLAVERLRPAPARVRRTGRTHGCPRSLRRPGCPRGIRRPASLRGPTSAFRSLYG